MTSRVLSLEFTPMGAQAPLALPIGLGHFLPWFTLDGDGFPLEASEAATIAHPPGVEDHRHWRDSRAVYRRTHRHLPEIGPYDSRDPVTIDWQFAAMNRAGLSGLIINWYGQNSIENVITLAVLRQLERWNQRHPDRSLCYCLSIDSQAQRPTEGKTPASLEEDLRYIQQHLMRPGYLLRDGRPLFLCFPYENNTPAWLEAFDACFGRDRYDFHWMNDAPGQGETGCYLWVEPDAHAVDHASPYPWQDPDNCGAARATQRYRDWSAESLGHGYGIGGVWPGFDDTLVAWAWKPDRPADEVRPRVIARHNSKGSCYEQLWGAYLAAMRDPAVLPLPIVQVVTWNDWAESTQIEPSIDHGQAAIHATRHYLEHARRDWRPA
ncbi:MAG: hypothetical protein AAF823_01760 [Planctomycetota bacterium]